MIAGPRCRWCDSAPDSQRQGQFAVVAHWAKGRHAIRLRYENTIEGSPYIHLAWTPPGGPPEIVLGSALFAPPPNVL